MAGKKYRVTGEQPVAGHQKGEEFIYDYTPEQETALIEGGAIEPVKSGGKQADAKGGSE